MGPCRTRRHEKWAFLYDFILPEARSVRGRRPLSIKLAPESDPDALTNPDLSPPRVRVRTQDRLSST